MGGDKVVPTRSGYSSVGSSSDGGPGYGQQGRNLWRQKKLDLPFLMGRTPMAGF